MRFLSHHFGEFVNSPLLDSAPIHHQYGDGPFLTNSVKWQGMTTKEPQPPNRIREYREKKGLTQVELGKRVGCPGETIAKLERLERGVDIRWMHVLAPHLDVEPWELVDGAPRLHPKIVHFLNAFDALGPEGQNEILKALAREARYAQVELPEALRPAE